MKRFILLKTGLEMYDLTKAYGFITFLSAAYSSNLFDNVGEFFIKLEQNSSNFVVTLNTDNEPNINSLKYKSFIASLYETDKYAQISFSKKKSAEDMLKKIRDMFLDKDFVLKLIDKYSENNFLDQFENKIKKSETLLGFIEPCALKAQRSSVAIFKTATQVEFPGEDIALSYIGNKEYSRYVYIKNNIQEIARVRFIYNPNKIIIDTKNSYIPEISISQNLPIDFIITYLSLKQVENIIELNLYSKCDIENLIFIFYKRVGRTFKPFTIRNGFYIKNALVIYEKSHDLFNFILNIFNKSFSDLNENSYTIESKISNLLQKYLETLDDEYLIKAILTLKKSNIEIQNVKGGLKEVMGDKIKNLITTEEIISLGNAFKKVSKNKKELIRRELMGIRPQDEKELFYLITDNLIQYCNFNKNNLDNIFVLNKNGYTPKDIAQGILFCSQIN